MTGVLRLLGTATAAALLVGGSVVLAPADAIPGAGPVVSGGDVHAHPGAVRATITFTKRPAHPWNSRISWDAYRQRVDGTWANVVHDSWRAGSGLPGASTTNSCMKGHGWLPNGTYTLRQYDDYPGSLIHGRAFRLSDQHCSNGT